MGTWVTLRKICPIPVLLALVALAPASAALTEPSPPPADASSCVPETGICWTIESRSDPMTLEVAATANLSAGGDELTATDASAEAEANASQAFVQARVDTLETGAGGGSKVGDDVDADLSVGSKHLIMWKETPDDWFVDDRRENTSTNGGPPRTAGPVGTSGGSSDASKPRVVAAGVEAGAPNPTELRGQGPPLPPQPPAEPIQSFTDELTGPVGVGPKLPGVFLSIAVVGAASALAFLVWSAWGQYSRIQKHDVLALGARDRLMDAVRSNPWGTLSDLVRLTGIDRSTARYHMKVLWSHGLVTCKKSGSTVRFHDCSAGRPAAYRTPLERILAETPPQEPRRLAGLLRRLMAEESYSWSGAWRTVHAAAARGVLELNRRGRSVWVVPATGHAPPLVRNE